MAGIQDTSSSQLSRLELLPPELRQHIYAYLGFPCSKIVQIHFPHEFPPGYMNFGNDSTSLCPGWTSGPVRLAGIRIFDASCESTRPILTSIPTSEPIKLPEICGGQGCGQRPLIHDRWMKVSTELMCTNRRLNDELSKILYSALEIEFGYGLHEYPVHKKEKKEFAYQRIDDLGNAISMAFQDSIMPYLTHITLSDQVGVFDTSIKIRPTHSFCTRVVQRQAGSLTYIAKHCKNLQILTIAVNPTIVWKSRQGRLEAITDALVEVVQSCKHLRRVDIKAYQHKPRCGCYNNRYANTAHHEPLAYPLVHEIVSWSEEEQQPDIESISAWANSTLREMKRNTGLIMVCPSAVRTAETR